jgi:hypothetical protein
MFLFLKKFLQFIDDLILQFLKGMLNPVENSLACSLRYNGCSPAATHPISPRVIVKRAGTSACKKSGWVASRQTTFE